MFGGNYFGQAYPGQGYTAAGTIQWDAASNSGYKASLSTYSWSHTVGAAAHPGLLVNVSIFVTGTVTSVTYNSVSLQFVRADTIGVYRNEIWKLAAPATGAHNIVVTLNTSVTSIASADSYSGVDQTDIVESHTGATGSTSTAPTVSTTPLDYDSWLVSGLTTSDTSMTVAGNATQRNNQTGALGTGAMSDVGPISPPVLTTMSWSAVGTLDSWALGVVVLDPYSSNAYSAVFTAVYSAAGTLSKKISRQLTASYKATGGLAKLLARVLIATYKTSGVLTKLSSALLTASYKTSGLLTVRSLTRSFAGLYTTSGSLVKRLTRSLSGTYRTSGVLSTAHQRFVTLTATFRTTGSLNRTISRTFSGLFSSSGSLTTATFRPFKFVPILLNLISGGKKDEVQASNDIADVQSGAKIDNVTSGIKTDEIQSGDKDTTISGSEKKVDL